jgi:hypothetical protein
MSGRSDEYLEWFAGTDTGVSSKVIWLVMMGMSVQLLGPGWPAPPQDPSDFGRCYRLLNRFPEWRQRLPEVAEKYPEWGPMVRGWEKLTEMYEHALEVQAQKAPEMYDLMQELLEEGRR